MRFISLFLILFTGCNLAPKYTKPDPQVSTAWRLQDGEAEPVSNELWWKQIGDDVLASLIDMAIEQNNDLQVAIWRVDQYFAQYQVARSPLFPQIALNSSATKEKLPLDENFLPQGFSPITPDYRLLLSLAYEIDFWGKVRNQASGANLEYLAAIENRRTVVLTLIGAVAQGYFLLRQLDAQLESAQRIMTSREESLQIARYRFEGGLTSEIEVDQAISVYQESIVTIRELERKVTEQENRLSVLLGQNPGPIPRGQTIYQWQLPEKIATGSPVELLTRRPDILQAENNLKAAFANIGVARAAFFPQLNFGALYGIDSLSLSSFFSQSSRTWSLGGTLAQQIFTGGALTGQLKIAQAEKEQLLFQYRQTILNALQEVNDALIGLEKAKEIARATELELAALRDYLRLAWERYYEGQTQYLTVLDAERQVFSVELDLADAEASQYQYLVDLYKALGGGWILEEDQNLKKKVE